MYPHFKKVEFKKEVFSYPLLDSTNSKAREFVQSGAPTGTTITAEKQTTGRGRGTHSWHSPPGGLYFSTLLMPSQPARAPELSLVAGVAITQAMKALVPQGVKVGLKWPNDILLENRKLAGILCESTGQENGMSIIGIGINVNTPKEQMEAFQGNPFPATSLSIELGKTFVIADVLEVTLSSLEKVYREYWERGFDSIVKAWQQNSYMLGGKIQVHYGSRIEEGVFVGLDSKGAIIVENALGNRNSFFSGEVTCYWPSM